MKATEFEFRRRALLIGLVYCIGFWLYAIDHVALIQAIARSSLRPRALSPVATAHLVAAIAAVLVAFGALVRTWGTAYLKSSVVFDANLHSDALVADGPFRHVRHPLYFASIVATLGFALLASRAGFLFIMIAMTLLYARLAGREEAELEREQGERYREFCRRVPKLWPSITPRVPATGAKPRWAQAIRGEMFMWAFALAIALLAETLSWKIFWSVLSAALVVFIIAQFLHNPRNKNTAAPA